MISFHPPFLKSLRISIGFLLLAAGSAAQTTATDTVPVRTWEVRAGFGHTVSYTDLSENRFAKDGGSAFYLGATKWLKPWLGISGDILRGRMNGDGSSFGSNTKYYYTCDLDAEVTFAALFQYGQVVRTNGLFTVAAYASIGAGWVNCTPEVYKRDVSGSANYLIDKTSGTVDDQVDYRGKYQMIVPVGVGFKARLSERTSLQLAGAYRIGFSDELNGFVVRPGKNDGYLVLSLGVAVQLGKQGDILQWMPAIPSGN